GAGLARHLQPERLDARCRAAVRDGRSGMRDAAPRCAACAGRARAGARPARRAAVPPRARDQRRRRLGVPDAPALCDAARVVSGGVECSDAVQGAPRVTYDVAIFGGGNAALCAALTAREAGRSVVVVERAPRHMRGGNSRHTRNLRCAHGAPTDVLTGAYEGDEFLSDLHRVNGGESDAGLSRLLIDRSRECAGWMAQHGVRFQAALRGTLHLSRTNAFFLGGGKALMNAYYAAAARLGIDVIYDADVVDVDLDGGAFRAATIDVAGERRAVRARAAVVATGGFEANLEWLRDAWGDAADRFIVRGTPYNTGTPLRLLLDAGAVPVGDPRGCHAIAVDARAPRFDGGIVTRLDCIPLGIVVNR